MAPKKAAVKEKEGKKSFSQIAREILAQTKGDRAKATEALKKAGCASAAGVVAKVAGNMGYHREKKSSPKANGKKATSSKKETKTTKKASPKATSKAESSSADEF